MMRPRFIELLGNWSNIQDINDIPRRLKKIDEWNNGEEFTDEEIQVLTFMRDVQATRETVRRKFNE